MEKEKDIFEIEMFGQRNEVRLDWASYGCNGTLALQLMCKPDEYEEGYYSQFGRMADTMYVVPYGVATVNLPDSEHLDLNEQFIDENNLPGIGEWLQRNNIARPTGRIGFSGYCMYPAYRFNAPKEALEKILSARQEIARRNNPSMNLNSNRHKR